MTNFPPAVATDQLTATRATLDLAWQAARSKVDWMHAPCLANYVNRSVSGEDLDRGGHWANYAAAKFLKPRIELSNNANSSLSMISLGCGSGHIEEALIRQFNWPISRFVGLDFDEKLRESARARFSTIDVESQFEFLDFNNPPSITERFDVVFACHAIHHANDLERFLPFMNGLLKDDGIIIGIDYFGPTRFQVEHEARQIIRELDSILPDELKRDLRDDEPVPRDIDFATIAEVRSADASESIRSSDLRTLLFACFPVVEVRPMGGTLLRWLLQYRAGNFDHGNPLHRAIAGFLVLIERTMIESRRIQSDDLFFVLGRSSRL